MMIVYVLEIITVNGETNINTPFSLESVGAYSSQESAIEAIKTLPPEREDLVYNIQGFELDAPASNSIDDIESDLKGMMNMGIVDQLVGEDGQFYYELTDAGKKIGKKLTKKDKKNKEAGW
jgi:hypothetical protein